VSAGCTAAVAPLAPCRRLCHRNSEDRAVVLDGAVVVPCSTTSACRCGVRVSVSVSFSFRVALHLHVNVPAVTAVMSACRDSRRSLMEVSMQSAELERQQLALREERRQQAARDREERLERSRRAVEVARMRKEEMRRLRGEILAGTLGPPSPVRALKDR
jgi:hypothetical protein